MPQWLSENPETHLVPDFLYVLFEKATAMTVGNVEPQRSQTRSQPVIDNLLQHLQPIGLVMKVRIIVQMIVALCEVMCDRSRHV